MKYERIAADRRESDQSAQFEPMEPRVLLSVAFEQIQIENVGEAPESVVLADLNGDSFLDLAVADEQLGTISILQGDAQGQFSDPQVFGVGRSLQDIQAVDVDGDGLLDLAAFDTQLGAMGLLRNTGQGVFEHLGFVYFPDGAVSAIAGDFGGDAGADFAVAYSDSVQVIIVNDLMGQFAQQGMGDGGPGGGSGGPGGGPFGIHLGPGTSYSVGTMPDFFTSADFNGDGRLDLAVTNEGGTRVAVLESAPGDTFNQAIMLDVGTDPSSVIAADVDVDGVPDLVVTNSADGTVSVLLNQDDGTFDPAITVEAGDQPDGVAVADLDGDGSPEFVSVNPFDGSITVSRFGAPTAIDTTTQTFVGGEPSSVAVGDITGDGLPDLVLADAANGRVSILITQGPDDGSGGHMGPPPSIRVVQDPAAVAVGDFNGDGVDDLAVAGEGEGSIFVLLSANTDPATIAPVIETTLYQGGQGLDSITAIDVDNDGDLDLVAFDHDSDALVLLTNIGDGQFTHGGFLAVGTGAETADAADLNGDGTPEFVAVFPTIDLVRVLDSTLSDFIPLDQFAGGQPDGSGGPGPDGSGSGSDTGFDPIIDLDGDGLPDDAPAGTDYTLGDGPELLTLADATGDGLTDILSADTLGDTVTILPGAADGTFGQAITLSPSDTPDRPRVLDATGDGVPDVLVPAEDGTVAIFAGDGAGGFTLDQTLDVGGEPVDVVGAVDPETGMKGLVVADELGGRIAPFAQDAQGAYTPLEPFRIEGEPIALAVANFDNDGFPDLVLVDQFNDSVLTLISSVGPGPGQGSDSFVPIAPEAPDLLPESDTGMSDSDNVTFLTNAPGSTLQFRIEGVEAGATVTLYAGTSPIGTAVVPEGQESVQIETDGRTVLPEGRYRLFATQTINGIESLPGRSMVMTIRVPLPDAPPPPVPLESESIVSQDVRDEVKSDAPRRSAVARISEDGDAIVFVRSDPKGPAVQVNLQQATSAPAITGSIVTTEEPKSTEIYAAGQSDDGLVLFTGRDDGTWEDRNLTTEITGAEPITASNLEVVTTPWGNVNITGLNDKNELVFYWQDGRKDSRGDFDWRFVNLNKVLDDDGQSMPDFKGQIDGFSTKWGAMNVAGIDDNGDLKVVWWSPTSGKWINSNLSDLTGAPRLTGLLTSFTTPWGAMNIAGVNEAGEVNVLWWTKGGQWRVTNLGRLDQAPTVVAGSLAAITSSAGNIHIAGLTTTGDVVTFNWITTTGQWSFKEITNPSSDPFVGTVSTLEQADGSISVFATTTTGQTFEHVKSFADTLPWEVHQFMG